MTRRAPDEPLKRLLVESAGPDGAARLSSRAIALRIGKSPAWVRKRLRSLAEAGEVEIERGLLANGHPDTNAYRLPAG